MKTKYCSICGLEKELSEYYVVENKGGVVRHDSRCKECVKEYNRKYSSSPEQREKRRQRSIKYSSDPENKVRQSLRSQNFYKSVSGRAKTLFKSAQRRSVQYSEFDISVEWIQEKLEKGVCEITGIPFDFEPHPVYDKNPFSPSIDRRDSTKGYTKENTRIVLWQVNLMRGEMLDEEIIEICKKVVEGLTREL